MSFVVPRWHMPPCQGGVGTIVGGAPAQVSAHLFKSCLALPSWALGGFPLWLRKCSCRKVRGGVVTFPALSVPLCAHLSSALSSWVSGPGSPWGPGGGAGILTEAAGWFAAEGELRVPCLPIEGGVRL